MVPNILSIVRCYRGHDVSATGSLFPSLGEMGGIWVSSCEINSSELITFSNLIGSLEPATFLLER
jgi:hypothetical protein